MDREPNIFIGYAEESSEVADNLYALLDDWSEATLWKCGPSVPGESFFHELADCAEKYDFAIMLYGAHDTVRKRGVLSGAPRDNVILETGLFMGKLGIERTFIIYCRDNKPDIPKNLRNIQCVTYKNRKDGDLEAALLPAMVKLKKAILKRGIIPKQIVSKNTEDCKTVSHKYTLDLLETIASGSSGLKLTCNSTRKLKAWQSNLLGMLFDEFHQRAGDVYVAWLRPIKEEDVLDVYAHKNLDNVSNHHRFQKGEGLVGKCWEKGVTASVSGLKEHDWWVYREGCENITYLCGCVGTAGGNGGMLVIGSSEGFELSFEDENRINIYAAFLQLIVTSTETGSGNNKD